MPNMYEYFVAQGLNLVGPNGWFSFIVPDRLGYNAQFVQLRKRILTEARIGSLLYKVPFPGVTADTLAFVIQSTNPTSDWTVAISEFDRKPISRKQSELLQHPSHVFEYFENAEVMSLVTAVSSRSVVKSLGQVCESTSGFGGKSCLIHASQTEPCEIPTLKGDSIGRYKLKKQYWFDFRPENITGRTTDQGSSAQSRRFWFERQATRSLLRLTIPESFRSSRCISFSTTSPTWSLSIFLGCLTPVCSPLTTALNRSLTRKALLRSRKSISTSCRSVSSISPTSLTNCTTITWSSWSNRCWRCTSSWASCGRRRRRPRSNVRPPPPTNKLTAWFMIFTA